MFRYSSARSFSPTILSEVPSDKKLPREGDIIIDKADGKRKTLQNIKFYVLLLFAKDNFISDRQIEVQNKLVNGLKELGRVLGSEAVVYFLIRNREPDFDRMEKYMKKFKLSLHKAPHIVITYKHPDDVNINKNILKVSLNRYPANRLYILISEITDMIWKRKVKRYRVVLRRLYEAIKLFLEDHKEDLIGTVCMVLKIYKEFKYEINPYKKIA